MQSRDSICIWSAFVNRNINIVVSRVNKGAAIALAGDLSVGHVVSV